MSITPESKWREIVKERSKPGHPCVFVELRRPEEGVCIFEAPQFGLTVRYDSSPNFAKRLKDFIDDHLSQHVNPTEAPNGTINLVLTDPAWPVEEQP